MLLQSLWFCLWGLLWAIFFITDGFDFGVGTLYPFIGKTEADKKTMILSVGPIWDGNEVWLITAGGVTFAAFPWVYSVMFSALYSPLMLILFALILRGVSFEFRSQVDHPTWKAVWDGCIFIGSFVPAFLFGVAFANIFQGLPIGKDGVFHGNLLTLLNPYGLLGGVLFVLLFLEHGALWICMKSDGALHDRAVRAANAIWPFLLITVLAFLSASAFVTTLYQNYVDYPALLSIIVIAAIALIVLKMMLARKAFFKAWIASSIAILFATCFGIAGLFPRMFPSNINPDFSLTAFNSSSSPLTLTIMLWVTVCFLPIVIGYQVWTYRLFWNNITNTDYGHDD
ncbi:MAG: cytochrome d ubiquinol oxidase subunit II [Desulfobacterales bacterium]|nr:cytochrome d ubiquinol oxidase subunit II [Desulfobacterales bacterium]